MKKMNFSELTKGIFKENPIFVLILGLCPTLGVTTSALNGFAMGMATLFVLILSNAIIALIKDLIPSKIRIPAYIIVIATLVTVLELVMKAYFQSLYAVLGIFIPLIVVNCIILGRAESYASKNSVINSIFDAIGNGIGFTLSLVLIGTIRELLGSGKVFELEIFKNLFDPALIFILPPGAFITIGVLVAIITKYKQKGRR